MWVLCNKVSSLLRSDTWWVFLLLPSFDITHTYTHTCTHTHTHTRTHTHTPQQLYEEGWLLAHSHCPRHNLHTLRVQEDTLSCACLFYVCTSAEECLHQSLGRRGLEDHGGVSVLSAEQGTRRREGWLDRFSIIWRETEGGRRRDKGGDRQRWEGAEESNSPRIILHLLLLQHIVRQIIPLDNATNCCTCTGINTAQSLYTITSADVARCSRVSRSLGIVALNHGTTAGCCSRSRLSTAPPTVHTRMLTRSERGPRMRMRALTTICEPFGCW